MIRILFFIFALLNYVVVTACNNMYAMPEKKSRYSDEFRKKRSEDYKKRGIKPPSQKGCIPWNKGKTGIYSKETLKRISDSAKEQMKRKPIVFTEEIRRKIGDAHRGEKCAFWKGGVSLKNSSERDIIMAQFDYVQWRRQVFERDRFICQLCFENSQKLRAHHIRTFAKYPELRTELTNGITLCEQCDCKKVIHREHQWVKFFMLQLADRKIIDYKQIDFLPVI